MNTKVKPNQAVFLFHILFWLLFTILSLMVYYSIIGQTKSIILLGLVNLIGNLILVYTHLFWLLPKFYDQEKYLPYSLLLVILLGLTSLIRIGLGWEANVQFNLGAEQFFDPTLYTGLLFGGVFLLIISLPLRFIDNLFKKQELEKELKTQQLEAELRFLKAQVNPHFLFNALNNIYALSFTKSEKAPEMILKLSEMMSYMLYECRAETVKLSSEIDYLKNYIDLQQLKKDGEQNIEFEVEGDLSGAFITPMLFIPFFENAFKHGNLDDTINGWVKGHLKVDREQIIFKISNSLSQGKRKEKQGGVGLENIRKRLELLYPNEHFIDIDKQTNTFNVHLKIQTT